MTSLDAIWTRYAAQIPGLPERRPDFRFDPGHYGARIGQPHAPPAELARHHLNQASAPPTFFAEHFATDTAAQAVLGDLVVDPDLAELIRMQAPDALHLACELIRLGAPVDAEVSDFSAELYLEQHPDIARARMDPLLHYLRHGAAEGRRILRNLRKSQFRGRQAFNPNRPTCLICVHEMSRTGAPIVGRDLAREAAQTHNVIVASLRDGPLLDEFRDVACLVLATANPGNDLQWHLSGPMARIDFAVVNSAISWNFIPFLVAQDIPFASYLHEYADYLHPAFNFNLFAMFSDLLIFSSEHVRDSWRGRMTDVKFNIDRDSTIIPQRPFFLGNAGPERQSSARARLSALTGRDLTAARIVVGAGNPHWRKGTDIFAMAAQIGRRRNDNTVFIWIGHGVVRDELGFGTYMAHHLDEIGTGQGQSNLIFIPAGPAYTDVLAASDIMFLSSRLDPLPNVVFDALEYGCRIVQFRGATGFNDPVYAASDRFTAVEFGNPEAAVEAILTLPRKSGPEVAGKRPDFPLFARIRDSLMKRLRAQKYHVIGPSALDVPIMFTGQGDLQHARMLERAKMLRYGRRRVWRDLQDVEDEIAAAGTWIHRRTRLAPYATCAPADLPPFALHIHAYYTDDLARDLKAFALYRWARRIVVTTDTPEKEAAIRRIMQAEGLAPEVRRVPNTGRDILPFMQLFNGDGPGAQDEVWCHLHQKKSVGSAPGAEVWRQFMLRILLGDDSQPSVAARMMADPRIGLVAPFDPHFIGWNESRHLLPRFAARLPGPLPENPLLFPVGNMFWTRRSVVLAMNALFGQDYPWPDEPIANDGTEFHLIERLWPAMASQQGLESVFLHKLDEQRV